MALELVRENDRVGYWSQVDPGEAGSNKPRISITDQEGNLIAKMAQRKLVLEIGTGLGISTLHLAKTARAVYTLDIDPWVWANVWPVVAEKKQNVAFMTSLDVCPAVQFAFIDGSHEYEAICADIENALELVTSPGKIVVHDTRAKIVKQATMDSGCRHFITSTYGLGVIDV